MSLNPGKESKFSRDAVQRTLSLRVGTPQLCTPSIPFTPSSKLIQRFTVNLPADCTSGPRACRCCAACAPSRPYLGNIGARCEGTTSYAALDTIRMQAAFAGALYRLAERSFDGVHGGLRSRCARRLLDARASSDRRSSLATALAVIRYLRARASESRQPTNYLVRNQTRQ